MSDVKRLWISGVAAVTLVAAGLGIGNAVADDAADSPADGIHYQSYFNEPTEHGGQDHKLRDQLVSYIDGAPEGSEIRAHITQLSEHGPMLVVRDALLNAHDRGVEIKIVNNGDANRHASLAEALGDNYVHCSTPEVENTACLSNVESGTHHMKNWYFSNTTPNDTEYHHMVVTTSYNITSTQSEHFNDMLVVTGDEPLYDAHAKVFDEDYFPQRKTDDRHSEPGGQIEVPSAPGYLAEFTPQKSGDLVADAYQQAEYEEGCELRIANLSLNREPVIEQILRIKEDGCDVRVVTDTPLESEHQDTFDAAGIEFREAPIHNKMTVFNGTYDGEADTVRILTGSHNLSTTPLRFRDDVVVGFSQQDMFDRYSDHFEKIWTAGS